jgi:hypothetical protein
MPLGDSITASTCVRPRLFQKLKSANYKFDFVGTKNDNGCSETAPAGFDADNEGHGCYAVRDILKTPPASYPQAGTHPDCNPTDPYRGDSSDLARWFDSQQPDVVLMHFGTNDLWSGADATSILSAYSAILSKLRSRNANVKLYVAKVIPLHPDAQKDYNALATALNNAIPGWATQNALGNSPISVVDQFTGFDATADTSDGVHPTPAGSEKMAQKWFDAIKTLF